MPAENFACKIFFGKNGQPLCGFPSGGRWQGSALTNEGRSLFSEYFFHAFPLPLFLLGRKFGKNGQPLCGFPLGGFSCRTAAYGRFGSLLCRIAAVMRGVAYYAQPIFDFPNISEEISEDQGAQHKRICVVKHQQPRGAIYAPRGSFLSIILNLS